MARLPPYRLGLRLGPAADRNLILLTATLVNFLDLFQLSSVLFGLPAIQQALGLAAGEANWVLVVYSIAFASLLLVGGQIGQRVGLETTFLGGTALLAVANVLNAAAPTKAALLVGRALAGAGAGLTAPNGLAMVSHTFADGAPRSQALALYTASAPLGSTLGTIVGSLLSSSAGWRFVFILCSLLAALALLLACLVLPRFPRTRMAIDGAGTLVFTVGIALLVYGVNDGARAGWRSPSVLVGVVLGACFCAALFVVEPRVANPVLPPALWTMTASSGPLALMLFTVFAFGGSFSAWFFLVTQLCVNLLGYTPVLTAVYFLPAAFAAIATGFLSALSAKALGDKRTLLVGLLVTAAGAVAWAFATPARAGRGAGSYWYPIVCAMLFVSGSPLAMVPAQSILLRHVPAGSHVIVAALFNTAYQVGASVLLAGANALMSAHTEVVGDGGGGGGGGGGSVPRVAMEGYRDAFWLLTGVLGAGVVLVAVCYWPGGEEGRGEVSQSEEPASEEGKTEAQRPSASV